MSMIDTRALIDPLLVEALSMMKRLIGGAAILALVATAAFWRLNTEAGGSRAAALG